MSIRTVPCRAALILAALGLAALPAPAAKKERLRVTPAENTTYRTALTQDQDVTVELGAMGPQKIRAVTRFEVGQHLAGKRKDGALELQVTYERAALQLDGLGQSTSFDTASPSTAGEGTNPALARMVSALIGKSFTVVLDPRGRVVDVTGLETIWEAMSAQAGSDDEARKAAESVRKTFSPDVMKGILQSSSVIFPERAVGPGDGWHDEVRTSNLALGPMNVRSDYSVVGAARKGAADCLELDVTTGMDPVGQSPLLEELTRFLTMGGAEARVETTPGRAEGAGKVWVERSTGLVAALELAQDMAMAIAVHTKQGEKEMKMDIAISMHQTTSLERLAP